MKITYKKESIIINGEEYPLSDFEKIDTFNHFNKDSHELNKELSYLKKEMSHYIKVLDTTKNTIKDFNERIRKIEEKILNL